MSSNIEITKTCELCGNTFIARKLTTQYCSHQCSQRAYKLRKREEKIQGVINSEAERFRFDQKSSTDFNPFQNDSTSLYTDIMNLDEVAALMGVNRMTIYRYCVQGKLKCIKMNRKIFIRRSDIESVFDSAPPYEVTPRQGKGQVQTEQASQSERECITEFYTADELAQRFGYSKSAIHKIAASKKIPKTTKRGVYLYSKPHFDVFLESRQVDESIKEWYSAEDIMNHYSMTKSAVYTFVSDNNIAKKNQQGKTLYAKTEVDSLLQHRLGDESVTEWYTTAQIQEVYGFKAGYTANFVYNHKIPKKRIGGKGYYSKQHFDQAVAEQKPTTEYITVEKAMELYGMSRDALYSCVKRHNIPKIKDGQIIKLQKSALEALFNPIKLYI